MDPLRTWPPSAHRAAQGEPRQRCRRRSGRPTHDRHLRAAAGPLPPATALAPAHSHLYIARFPEDRYARAASRMRGPGASPRILKRAEKGPAMALYEHVFIARQDLSNQQAEALIENFGQILTDNGGTVAGTEYWGLRTLAYRMNRNRKGHYGFIKSDSPAPAVQEMERLMRLHEDVMRVLTIKVDAHEEGPSAVIQAKSS